MGSPTNAFTAEYGTAQGRIKPANWTAPSGEYVLQLGHDRPGVVATMKAGDEHFVGQSFDIDLDASFVRSIVHVRPATLPLPPGWSWTAAGLVVGSISVVWTIDVVPGEREHTRYDLAIPLNNGRGDVGDTLGFTLVLNGPAGQFADVELPGIYVDSVVVDKTPHGPTLIDRFPEPGDTNVPGATSITVGFADSSGVGVTLTSIYVDGQLVLSTSFTTQTFLAAGWTLDDAHQLDDSSFIVTITPPVAFPSQHVVTVRALARLGAQPAPTMDATYVFTIADTTAPLILEAFAPSEITVRITYDEAIEQLGAAVDGDALNPSSYALSVVGGAPAVTPGVVGVASEGASVVVLSLDKIMTRGATYMVTVTGVKDVWGNQIVAPDNTATFTGFTWPVPPGRRTSLFEKLSDDIQARDVTGDHRRFLAVPQEVIDLYYGLADRLLDIIDPDFAPIEWVDLMLLDLGNPFDLFELSEAEKRILARTLIRIYKRKGTGPGIVSTIRFFLGIDVEVHVYAWAPFPIGQAVIGQTFVLGSSTQSDLYTFEVVVPTFLTDAQRKAIVAIVDYMRVAHEHFKIVEPTPPLVIDHWQIGFSRLGTQTFLHGP